MVKKRRIAHQTSLKSILKEEDDDDNDNDIPMDMDEDEETDHLKDVLKELRVKSEFDDDENILDEDDEDEEYQHKPSSTRKSRRSAIRELTPPLTGRGSRKRRRRDDSDDAAFHHTYVMKLFDRTVDLAQFTDDTPLYPICRAWMANQPRNSTLNIKQRTPTPEPPPSDEENKNGDEKDKEGKIKNEKEDSDSDSDAELVKDTYKLPPPIQLSPDSVGKGSAHRVPTPIIRPKLSFEEFKKATDGHNIISREALLDSHSMHWNSVRESWHRIDNQNQERYIMSERILGAIYRRAQKAFE